MMLYRILSQLAGKLCVLSKTREFLTKLRI
nr:MAG TPA: hypothetical protein [Caudoviricetes sp.]